MTFPARILVVDDDPMVRKSLCGLLELEGHEVQVSDSVDGARDSLASSSFHLVLADVKMPGSDGFDLLKFTRETYPQTQVVMITGFGSIDQAVRAIKMGAHDYLTKPIMDEQVSLVLDRALQEHHSVETGGGFDDQGNGEDRLGSLIGRDHKMHQVFELMKIVADSRATVLLTGQSGTGKSLVAREIHNHSLRRDGPFVEVSCGALPDTLLESELFGHIKGSFTGALTDTQGKFEAAHGGTIFLDEISVASPAMQVKLLRVLESAEFQKVGGNKNVSVDARVVLATNNDLEGEVKRGKFREDLYYRIQVVTIELPPLRDRVGDIPVLAQEFLRAYNAKNGRHLAGYSPLTMHKLQHYSWPGNVRELENVVERAVILARGDQVTVEDLPASVVTFAEGPGPGRSAGLKASLADPEREIIERALSLHNGGRADTAEYLGVSRTTLYHKMKKHRLLKPRRARKEKSSK